ncbi:MAG: ABC transporter permease [Candidatus Heimdallarchaeota archaeon]|nr:MAG: ABC transporter permease [Candidatus Heimdallarchaeota archaeon]
MKKMIKYRKSRKERFKEKICAYSKEKRGMFGLFTLLFFALMGVYVPFLAESGALPPPNGLESYVASDYLPPSWIELFPKSLIPGSGNIVPDTQFKKTNSWFFNVSDPSAMAFDYDSEDFIIGTKSVHFSLVDNHTALNYQGNIRGNLIFPWPFSHPTNASLYWYMKIMVTGNLSMSSFSPYVRLHLPEDSAIPQYSTDFRVTPPQHSEWIQYTRYLSYIQVFYLFQPNTTINIEIGVNFRDTTPSSVGTIQIWFDQIELYVTRPTHGLLGSNHQGQDVFVQICYSIQVSFFVAFVAGITSLIMGVIIGVIAGYRAGGVFDTVIMRIVDLFLVYPALLIIFLLMWQYKVILSFLPFLIALFTWPTTTRVIRSRVIVEREQLYIESAKAAGASDWYIIFQYILPNILGLIFIQFTTNAANAVNLEAALSYLDYPYKRPVFEEERRAKKLPSWLSWGFMLAEVHFEAGYHNGAWWVIIPPGICIFLMTISFMFIGNALDRVFNPLKFQDRSFKHNF